MPAKRSVICIWVIFPWTLNLRDFHSKKKLRMHQRPANAVIEIVWKYPLGHETVISWRTWRRWRKSRFEGRKKGNRLRDFRRLNHENFQRKPLPLYEMIVNCNKVPSRMTFSHLLCPRGAHKSRTLVSHSTVFFPRYGRHAMTFNLWHLATMRQQWGEKKIGCEA